MKLSKVAIIRESDCIGCTKCIAVCPTDAIIGSHQWMHTVIAEDCIGCGLCLPPCPVDCIEMVEGEFNTNKKEYFKNRYQARKVRQAIENIPVVDKKSYLADLMAKLSKKG